MKDIKRPMVALAASGLLALGGAGSAWACGDGQSGSDAGTYPGESTSTTSSDSTSSDGSTTTTATTAAARTARARKARARRAAARRAAARAAARA